MSNRLCIVAVIAPDRKIHKEVASALNGNAKIQKLWMSAEYPDPTSLAEMPKTAGGCIVFLDFSDKIRAKAVAAELENFYPMARTIALHSASQSQDLIDLMQLGVREIVRLPVRVAM